MSELWSVLLCLLLFLTLPSMPSLLSLWQEILVLDEADRLLEMGFEQRSEVIH